MRKVHDKQSGNNALSEGADPILIHNGVLRPSEAQSSAAPGQLQFCRLGIDRITLSLFLKDLAAYQNFFQQIPIPDGAGASFFRDDELWNCPALDQNSRRRKAPIHNGMVGHLAHFS